MSADWPEQIERRARYLLATPPPDADPATRLVHRLCTRLHYEVLPHEFPTLRAQAEAVARDTEIPAAGDERAFDALAQAVRERLPGAHAGTPGPETHPEPAPSRRSLQRFGPLCVGETLHAGWSLSALEADDTQVDVTAATGAGAQVTFVLEQPGQPDAESGPFDLHGLPIFYRQTESAWPIIEPVGWALRAALEANLDGGTAAQAWPRWAEAGQDGPRNTRTESTAGEGLPHSDAGTSAPDTPSEPAPSQSLRCFGPLCVGEILHAGWILSALEACGAQVDVTAVTDADAQVTFVLEQPGQPGAESGPLDLHDLRICYRHTESAWPVIEPVGRALRAALEASLGGATAAQAWSRWADADQDWPEITCTRPWTTLSIPDPRGDIVQCAPDRTRGHRGNIGEGSLLEIWNGEGYRSARQHMLSDPQRLCRAICPRLSDGERSQGRFDSGRLTENERVIALDMAARRTAVNGRPVELSIHAGVPDRVWDEVAELLPTLAVLEVRASDGTSEVYERPDASALTRARDAARDGR